MATLESTICCGSDYGYGCGCGCVAWLGSWESNTTNSHNIDNVRAVFVVYDCDANLV